MENLGLIDHLMYMADQHNVASLIMSGAMVLGAADDDEPLNPDAIAEHLAARLQKIPMLRKQFVQDPLHLGSVKKADDPDYDVWDHVDVVHLPSPGNYDQLRSAIADYANQPFGLQEVFEFLVIGGLEGGRVALASKIHHAFVDGMGAAEIMKSVFDEQPVPLEKVRGRRRHRSASVPTAFKLTRNAIGENLDRMFRKVPKVIYKSAPSIVSSLSKAFDKKSPDEDAKQQDARPEFQPTSLNHMPNEASFRTLSYSVLQLKELKFISKQFGCTVNDLALVLFTCALERYFESTGEEINFDLLAAMPISLRGSSQVSGGNQLTGAIISLHNTEKNLVARLRKINNETSKAKSEMRPESSDSALDLQEIADLIAPPILDLVLYVAGKTRLIEKFESKLGFMNTFFTNVPGYPVTSYLGNARLEYGIPMIPAVPLLALSPGVTSSGDTFIFGFNCDGSVIDDSEVFIEGLQRGLSQLRKSASGKAEPRGNKSIRPATTRATNGAKRGTVRKTPNRKKATTRRLTK